jgi:hypothetical protein
VAVAVEEGVAVEVLQQGMLAAAAAALAVPEGTVTVLPGATVAGLAAHLTELPGQLRPTDPTEVGMATQVALLAPARGGEDGFLIINDLFLTFLLFYVIGAGS